MIFLIQYCFFLFLAEPILQEYVQSLIRSYANNMEDLVRTLFANLPIWWAGDSQLS